MTRDATEQQIRAQQGMASNVLPKSVPLSDTDLALASAVSCNKASRVPRIVSATTRNGGDCPVQAALRSVRVRCLSGRSADTWLLARVLAFPCHYSNSTERNAYQDAPSFVSLTVDGRVQAAFHEHGAMNSGTR